MSVTHRLTDEAMEQIRASEAFRELDPDRAARLEEALYEALPIATGLSSEEARSRLAAHAPETLSAGPMLDLILEATRTP
jgi:hypothetical protein